MVRPTLSNGRRRGRDEHAGRKADQYNAINKLEEIQFCYDESHQKTLGDEVANTLIQAALSATGDGINYICVIRN